ncbi:MAG: histidinol dehydrogenase, partial [Planctomycetes bacterium]|nr:histidinol dehydrogenase [Planctomycetota bacterium]
MTDQLADILILSSQPDFQQKLSAVRQTIINAAGFESGSEQQQQLINIVNEVAKTGDKALVEFTEKFDNVKLMPNQFKIDKAQLKKAHDGIDADLLKALRKSIENVRKYQTEIFMSGKNNHPGVKYTPLNRIGICIPGASAPLPSTVIMSAVPAQVAGVKEIVIISPPRCENSIHPVIQALCFELGIDEVYRVGGAQAVAALAYGTETIKKVNKIVGPGNQWVQMAKKQVFGKVDIDSIAGPSEVLIIADDSANPAWVAADMLSQAEHAPGSAYLFTVSQKIAEEVIAELEKQVDQLKRRDETIASLKKSSGVIVFGDMDDLIQRANEFAAEHLQVQCGDQSRKIANQVQNAGAIFIGDYSPV